MRKMPTYTTAVAYLMGSTLRSAERRKRSWIKVGGLIAFELRSSPSTFVRRISCRGEREPCSGYAFRGLARDYIWVYVTPMTHISIRDLQKISGEAIGALPGPTPVKSGDRTVGLLIPLKAADPDRLAAILMRAEALAKGRDVAADDAALAAMGVDPTNWSLEAVRALMAERAKQA